MRNTRLVLIKFKVRGNLRFLSHAEMVKVFQRACVRAGIEIQHSQGFNPRPKLSLPLPKAVGVEVDDDLLCLRMSRDPDESRIKARLSGQLPDGFQLLSVRVATAFTGVDSSLQKWGEKTPPKASTAMYVLAVQSEYINEKLKSRIKHLLASESLKLQRQINSKNSKFENRNPKFKEVDIRPFLKSVELNGRNIVVECKISPAGSIRIDEILELLELDVKKLASPIRRTSIQWQEA